MSRYHGSKISGTKQSLLTETAICVVERWNKVMGYHIVPESNHAQERHTCHVFRFNYSALYRATVC